MFAIKRLWNTTKYLYESQRSASPAAHKPEPSKDTVTEDTWVYVWNLTANKVGHTAIQVGGTGPKCEESDGGEYISIHPNLIPAIGPTIVLPLPAALSNTLEEDMALEGAAAVKQDQSIDGIAGIPGELLGQDTPNSLSPDHVIKVPGLNTQAMRAHIKEVRAGIETGQTAYQLLPKINALKFFREMPYYLNYDPVDIKDVPNPGKSNKNSPKVYNCATLVGQLLEVGGMPAMEPSMLPYKPTPNDIAESLSKSF